MLFTWIITIARLHKSRSFFGSPVGGARAQGFGSRAWAASHYVWEPALRTLPDLCQRWCGCPCPWCCWHLRGRWCPVLLASLLSLAFLLRAWDGRALCHTWRHRRQALRRGVGRGREGDVGLQMPSPGVGGWVGRCSWSLRDWSPHSLGPATATAQFPVAIGGAGSGAKGAEHCWRPPSPRVPSPTFRCVGVRNSPESGCAGQRHLGWVVDVLLAVGWRSETKRASHEAMMLTPLTQWLWLKVKMF